MLFTTTDNQRVLESCQNILALANQEIKSIVPNVKLQIELVEILPTIEGTGYFFKVKLAHNNSYQYWLDWTEELGAWIEADGKQATITIKQSRLLETTPLESSLITCLTSHIAATCLCLQGTIAIHANVITLKNKSLAFAGDSGKGKSTLTAYCVAQGAGFVTDDVLVLDSENIPHSGSLRIKLYPSVAADLGLEVKTDNDYKIHYDPQLLGAKIPEKPSPVTVLYILEESPNNTIYTETLDLGNAITHLIRHSYHSSVLIKDNPALFNEYIDLAQRLEVKKLFYPRNLALLPQVYHYLQQDN